MFAKCGNYKKEVIFMSEHKNILKKIRCVKSEYLDESLLKEYYEYILDKK